MNRPELIAFPDTETLVQQVAARWLCFHLGVELKLQMNTCEMF